MSVGVVGKTIRAVGSTANSPKGRLFFYIYLLAALWLTPASSQAGQTIQTIVASLLIGVATADSSIHLWSSGKKGLSFLCALVGVGFWVVTVGGWMVQ